MYYYLILALKGFCIYHIYINNREKYWYYVILFIPVVGCIIYIFTQVFRKKDINTLQKEVIQVFNPSAKIKALENKVAFSDTFQNRVLLADALYESRVYEQAILHYEKAINKRYEEDMHVTQMLIKCYTETAQYNKVIYCAEHIILKTGFKGSRSQFLYGMALEEMGQSELAEVQLRSIDQRFSNYTERYHLAQFLNKKNKGTQAKEILEEIINEFKYMSKPNKKIYRGVVTEVKKLYESL